MEVRVILGDLAAETGAVVEGDPSRVVTGIAPLESAGPTDLSFLANPKYAPQLERTRAGAVFVSPSVERRPDGPTLLKVGHPYLAFARAAGRFDTRPQPRPGIHPSASVPSSVRLGAEVSIGPLCVIGEGATIGDRSVLRALVYVGEEARIGADCHLHAQVSIRERCVLGDRVVIQNGAQIGGDGYGFVPAGGHYEKIPQIGNVVIGDDVEIGALCAVDRATMASTVIGRGCKLDDLVMVAHNVEVGEHTLLVAQVGISGSTRIGRHAVLGGQVGVVGHITIGDLAQVAAKSGVSKNLKGGRAYAGYPAVPIQEWRRATALAARLESMRRELRRLSEEIETLKKNCP